MKKLLCFDLDGTLTQHHSPLSRETRDLLLMLKRKYTLLMVGAGAAERIARQMNYFDIGIIGNYGMEEAKVENGKFVLLNVTVEYPDRAFFTEKIEYLREKYGYTEFKGEGVEFHPAGMVTFPLLGTKADINDKIVFDPDRKKRKVMFPEVKEIFKDYTVFIGGSSSFDFTKARFNKYDAIKSYAEKNGFSLDEVLFVGDDFGDGGGDSHVRLGGLDYIEITDYKTVGEKLSYLL